MSRSKSEIEKFICETYKQSSADCVEGPARAGRYLITRVWTKDRRGEYHAHYAVEHGESITPYENFSPFAVWLAHELDRDKAAARRERLMRTRVASIVVLGGFAVFAYATLQNPSATPIGYIATAVVGGGAGLLFGNWSRNSSGT